MKQFLLLMVFFSSLIIGQEIMDSTKQSNQSAKFLTKQQKYGYALGLDLGTNFKMQYIDVDLDALMLGIREGIAGQRNYMSEEEFNNTVDQFQSEQRELFTKMKKEVSDKNKAEGQKFLDENKKKPGVIALANGLQYRVIKSGSGASPKATDKVTAHYTGKLIDGKVFDSSVERGQPFTTELNKVIKGWTEIIQLMKVGDKWEVFIPSELAYGENGAGTIEPNSVLIFEIELLDIGDKK